MKEDERAFTQNSTECGFCRKSLEGLLKVPGPFDLLQCQVCGEFWFHHVENGVDLVEGSWQAKTTDKWIPIGKRKEVLSEDKYSLTR